MSKKNEPEPYTLIVRKEHVVCVVCGAVEPLHPGDGTPAPTFIWALQRLARIHANCKAPVHSS